MRISDKDFPDAVERVVREYFDREISENGYYWVGIEQEVFFAQQA
jgi:hypothetical protein